MGGGGEVKQGFLFFFLKKDKIGNHSKREDSKQKRHNAHSCQGLCDMDLAQSARGGDALKFSDTVQASESQESCQWLWSMRNACSRENKIKLI